MPGTSPGMTEQMSTGVRWSALFQFDFQAATLSVVIARLDRAIQYPEAGCD
jgi:hypothetical protein